MDFLVTSCSTSIESPIGRPIILPSSFQGSPRNMQERYHDAMTIVLKYGRPDLFITFTCNPTWSEISENLFAGQTTTDRPDIVCRVFKIKLNAFISDILKNKIFGTSLAYVYTIEFQKRGLPHAHLLIILSKENKIETSEAIDNYVSAEIPDRLTNPKLFAIVTRCMIHGPCGIINPQSPCMDKGMCTKNFPKDFQNATKSNINGYPSYKRRNLAPILISKKWVDNRFVIPYNSYLLLKYNAHINVEICTSIKSVKYIFKYVYKGYDCANVVLNVDSPPTKYDEINNHINARYVSSCEAMWRLLENPMHDRSHAIIRLAVHMPFKQLIYFQQGPEKSAMERAIYKNTTLTAWFILNQLSPCARKTFMISNVGNAFIFVYFFSTCLELRAEFLRTVDGILLNMFKDAAINRSLLCDDNEWEKCLDEASLFLMPSQLRHTFAFICVFGHPQNPTSLCNQFGFTYILTTLSVHGYNCKDFNLPTPDPIPQSNLYDAIIEADTACVMVANLNLLQRNAFDKVIQAIADPSFTPKYFYIDGPGGSGKTYLYNTLMHYLRGQHKTVIPFATTGISSILLIGGRTIHSGFKIPVPILDTSVSRMKTNSIEAQKLKNAHLIIIDEVSMMTKHALRCIDLLLRDIMQTSNPFGGKVILLGGDFRQTLPVIPRGTKTSILESCIKCSPLWHIFLQLKLKDNMRILDDDSEYNNWLLQIGEGKTPTLSPLTSDYVEIPLTMIEESLIYSIYGDFNLLNNVEYLAQRIILTTKNKVALALNNDIISKLPSPIKHYYSSDSLISDNVDDSNNYPIEFLHSLTPSGMPPHINNIPFTIAKPSSSPTIVIYGKLCARELQHHLQKRHHIEQRKENFFTIAKPSSSPTT
ncbi:uncharacterized protein LOC135930767, partial [Gordionus sp. m RMFG-2023]|uniref:uncharacterized protein LOC135930767 n=1 Tax=Gordionus sp. m RMFG-2023 TaxID=3053472 RepID=UPI0031FD49DA